MDGNASGAMKPYQESPGPVIDFKASFPDLDSNLKGANVLITGGASGLGKACATEFLQKGGYVTIADLDTPVLSATAKELSALAGDRVQAIACNVTDWSAQCRLFASAAKLGPKGVIDVVIPFAGPPGTQFSFDAPDRNDTNIPKPPTVGCIQVALVGMLYTCQLALWYMARKKESLRCLIVIGSMTAYRGIAGNGDYTGAKYGARGMFKALRDAPGNLESAADGPALRVNYLCPGYVQTPLVAKSIEAIEKAGARFAPIETLVGGVMRMAADNSIHGKGVGVAPDGCFDLRDDYDGSNGFTAVDEQAWFFRKEDINRSRIGIW